MQRQVVGSRLVSGCWIQRRSSALVGNYYVAQRYLLSSRISRSGSHYSHFHLVQKARTRVVNATSTN
jgi:hypothetical protein